MAFTNLFKGFGGKEADQAVTSQPGENDSGGAETAPGNTASAFFAGTSKFFNSVQAKKDGLMSDLSSKLNSVKMETGFGSGGDGSKRDVQSRGGDAGGDGDDSSASEYGDDGDQPMYADEAPSERRLSAESIDSLSENEAKSYRTDIGNFVGNIINPKNADPDNSLEQKFRGYIAHHTGRSAFARELKKQTENVKEVPGNVLHRLVRYGGLVLEQCNGSDDFSPACSLLNSAFRLFQQEVAPNGRVTQTFMYAGLRDQQIWQSTRFWNAAVFLALQQERSVQASATTGTENDLDLEKELHDALAFSQLSKFAWRIYSLGLSKEACLDFLRRQAEDAALSKEKQRLLRANVLKFYSE
uniref:Uncharacterized protein KIAA0513 n=1 Tax=Schistocephalus solidus TaxID=70667 RepID=A0A0X3NXV3_SCHSO